MIFCPAEYKIFGLDLQHAPIYLACVGPLQPAADHFYRVSIYKKGVWQGTRVIYYKQLKRLIRYHELVEK